MICVDEVEVGRRRAGGTHPLLFMLGPCVLESIERTRRIAGRLVEIAARHGISWIFKSSFDKANRSSASAYRGPGLERGLDWLAAIKEEFDVDVVTDIHEPAQAGRAAEVADVLQIPAFLCRQTDLLVAAGRTGKTVNIKKGQFMAPHDIGHAAAKVASTGNQRILLTDRGTSFGYNALVADMRGIPVMSRTGYPVVFDATHSVQQPGGLGDRTGGDREMIPPLARAAVAAGCHGVFLECHEDPDSSPSDAANMLSLDALDRLLPRLAGLGELVRSWR